MWLMNDAISSVWRGRARWTAISPLIVCTACSGLTSTTGKSFCQAANTCCQVSSKPVIVADQDISHVHLDLLVGLGHDALAGSHLAHIAFVHQTSELDFLCRMNDPQGIASLTQPGFDQLDRFQNDHFLL